MRALALLAAVTAAALVPHAPLGIDVLLVAVLIAGTIAGGLRRSLDAMLFGGLAFGLACVPALLDADWVVTIDLAAAFLLAAVAVAGVRLAALVAPFRSLGALPSLAPTVPAGWAPAARGAIFGSVLVLPFGALFWTADAMFAELGRGMPLASLSSLPARVVVFVLVLCCALGLALAARREWSDPALPSTRRFSLPEWAVPLALLDLLFLTFVVVQMGVLFGGHDHVLETTGLTYAEYARQGFWQLIVAAALTLGVIAAALGFADTRSSRERAALRGLVGALCLLTIVIVVSALHRLHLYEAAFGLTRTRLAAESLAWGLGGFFALLLLAGAVGRIRTHLARIAVAGAGVGLLAFSLSNPDGRIAERNVDRWRATGNLDVAYLQGLSADAVPALAELPAPVRQIVLAPVSSRLEDDEPWASANYSRHRARELLAP